MRPVRCLFSLLSLLLAIPVLAQAPPSPSTPDVVQIHSHIMGEIRYALVRTPAGYATSNRRYPVLYLTDGGAQFNHTVSTVEFLARSERMPEMIVVGILNTDRQRDLTPTKVAAITDSAARGAMPASGGADRFLDFIEQDLIPRIEKDYRTQPFRIFAGHSLGGLFGAWTLATRPALFQSWILVSPSMRWDDFVALGRLEKTLEENRDLRGTIFLGVGGEGPEMLDGVHRLERLLKKKAPRRLEWSSKSYPDENHGTVVLRAHYDGLKAIFALWLPPETLLNGTNPDPLPALEKHFRMLSRNFGYEVEVPERMINQVGYQQLMANRFDKAIEILSENVRRYPDSANVYDSLGEACEKTGKLELARDNYKKAADLAFSKQDPSQTFYRRNFDRVVAVIEAGAKNKP